MRVIGWLFEEDEVDVLDASLFEEDEVEVLEDSPLHPAAAKTETTVTMVQNNLRIRCIRTGKHVHVIGERRSV